MTLLFGILYYHPKPPFKATILALLIALIRANLIIHVSPVHRAINGRLVAATALVLKYGTSGAMSVGRRDDIVPYTIDVVCFLFLDTNNVPLPGHRDLQQTPFSIPVMVKQEPPPLASSHIKMVAARASRVLARSLALAIPTASTLR